MKNVYDEVLHFYDKELTQEPAIQQEWVEGYLRQKAWQGASDDNLRFVWKHIRAFSLFLDIKEYDFDGFLEDLDIMDYSLAVEWICGNKFGIARNIKSIRQLFDTLTDFFRYLHGKKLIEDYLQIETAAAAIAGGKKLRLSPESLADMMRPPAPQDMNLGQGAGDSGLALSKAIERLMGKLGAFFQHQEFAEDFRRALMLYSGPLIPVPEDANDEFWLGFWDYFLFDYHLLLTDTSPLTHFQTHAARLSGEEQIILQELLSARFCVFYISQVVNHDWVECVNLFTEETFRLPHPQFHHKQVKRMLFFGHVFSRDNVMVNYVTSIEVSANLRRRIKEEVQRQKALFNIQEPEAGWEEMLRRHALAVRHTIDVLSTMAKVNVTPFSQVNRQFPAITRRAVPNEAVVKLLEQHMPNFGCSLHDIRLTKRMWHDFSQMTDVIVRKPGVWAGALIQAFTQINTPYAVPAEPLASDMGVSAGGIYTNKNKLFQVLELEKFDPRYLNEEGLVISLFDGY